MKYSNEIKIPNERIAVLIGEKGKTRRKIEEITNSKIKIDSKEGDVVIYNKEGINVFLASQIIKAIARGFNPDVAIQLINPEYVLELINMQEYAKTKNDIKRLKGRVIGKGGKARKTIERLTETKISVYGKSVAIIGKITECLEAKRAIESILNGKPHSKAYAFLQKRMKEIRLKELIGSDKIYK